MIVVLVFGLIAVTRVSYVLRGALHVAQATHVMYVSRVWHTRAADWKFAQTERLLAKESVSSAPRAALSAAHPTYARDANRPMLLPWVPVSKVEASAWRPSMVYEPPEHLTAYHVVQMGVLPAKKDTL